MCIDSLLVKNWNSPGGRVFDWSMQKMVDLIVAGIEVLAAMVKAPAVGHPLSSASYKLNTFHIYSQHF